MSILQKQRLISVGVLLLLCQTASTINPPSNPCPRTFQYMSFGNTYIGMVTLNNLPLQTTVVEVEFSQRESITTGFNGRLSLKEDTSKVQSSLERGQPISYRVDFPNDHVLPKLTGIKVNGNTICSGRGYGPPSTTFKVQHSFFPSTITTYNRKADNFGDITEISSPSIGPRYEENPFIRNMLQHNLGRSGYGSLMTAPAPPVLTVPQPLNLTPRPAPAQSSPFRPQPTPSSSVVQCGREGLTPFVANGNDFERGKFPWLTAIYIRVGADLKFNCGGSLISSRTVITAAHCFPSTNFPPDRISIVLGRHNLFVSEEGSQQRDVASLSVHPNYNISVIADADMALLHMKIGVSFNQFIRPICLWSQTADLSLIVNKEAFVAGWGSDNNGNRVTANAKMVKARIVSESECLRSSDLFSVISSSRSICAGNRDGSGPCLGDSGGGLMLYSSGVWTLRAVVSIGPTEAHKCDLNHFVVYCDVAQHITWIRQNMLS